MPISLIILTFHNINVVISVTELLISLLIFITFCLARHLMFSKFNIKVSPKLNKKFWLGNVIITMLLGFGSILISANISHNAMEVSNGFTIQFI